MISYIFKKIIGSKNDREVKKLRPMVARINEIEQGFQSLSDEALRQKTAEWKARLIGICFLDAPRFKETCFCVGIIFAEFLLVGGNVNHGFPAFSLFR